HPGLDALAVKQVGLGGPALAAGLAAVGGGDQLDDGGDVGGGGGAEARHVHPRILGSASSLGSTGHGTGGGRRRRIVAGPRLAGRRRSGEQAAGLFQGGDEAVDLVVGVVEGQRGAQGRGHAVVLQQRVRAVLARAHGHAFQVQQGGQVVRVG